MRDHHFPQSTKRKDKRMTEKTRDTYEEREGIPRWLKVLGLLALVVVVLAFLIMLIGGGEHGPQRHGAGADAVAASAEVWRS